MPNLTVNVTPELLKQAKIYASQHKTTVSEIVRGNLNELTKSNRTILEKYSDGVISSADAQDSLNLKNKNELFHALSSSGLSIYHVNRHLADKMANDALILAGLK